jgi:hypothetical protein
MGVSVLVTFSFSMASSSITLSIRRRDALSSTSTFPLEGIVRLGGHEGREVVLERTSPWVTCRMVFRITALVLVLYDKDEVHG